MAFRNKIQLLSDNFLRKIISILYGLYLLSIDKYLSHLIKKGETYKIECILKFYSFIYQLIYHRVLKFNQFTLSSPLNYCKLNLHKYRIISDLQKCYVYPPFFWGSTGKQPIQVNQPEVYVCEISESKIVGGSTVIYTKDNYALLDIAVSPDSRRYQLNGKNIYYYDEKQILSCYSEDLANNQIECGIMLNGNFSFNYYHWLIEFLPKFLLIDLNNDYDEIPLIVDRTIIKIPQLQEALNILNVKKRKLVIVEENYQYKVKRLIFPSFVNWIPSNIKKGFQFKAEDYIITNDSIQYIRKCVFKKIKFENNTNLKRIFISRKTQKRRSYNESEILPIFLEKGFEVIYPEEMSFKEQVITFSNAEIIAGASGAAFTNIVFAQSHTKVICFMSKKYDISIFSNIAGLLDLEMVYLANDLSDKGHYQNNFKISSELVREFLQEFIPK